MGLDLKKAFNNVSHEAILDNRTHLDVAARTFCYIQDFITGRTATIRVGEHQSSSVQLARRKRNPTRSVENTLRLPPNAPTTLLLALGVHNTIDELVEGHLSSQTLRLSATEAGGTLFKTVVTIPRAMREKLLIPPIPKNMHLEFYQERREARRKSLQQRYYSDPQAVYTDAAEHAHRAAMTAVVTNKEGAIENICSIPGSTSEEAEKAAITRENSRTIISDSKTVIRNFACGHNSASARQRIPTPQSKISLIWIPAQAGLPGNLAAHNSARESAYRAWAIYGQESASGFRDHPQTYQETHIGISTFAGHLSTRAQ
ncbi:hypothetical protein HPB47_004740, partial [Ixodes persulcatus]